MKEQAVQFQFKARYYIAGTLNQQTKNVWIVLHGYGQLAQYFLKKFNALVDSETCVIAPEGLSRFYVEDLPTRTRTGNNRVGATWMTRENRLMDIDNYCEYLTTIYKTALEKYPEVCINLLGFSQGAATASRWALDSRINLHRLILWSGILPPDMDFEAGKRILSGKEFLVVYGNNDPFITPDRLNEMKQLTLKLGIAPELITFAGGHDIDESTLLQLKDLS
ncbi:MAG: alpha/beta hydrolase [Cyclobacteriaceae bacterium]|nr:alpha/beta hydrolase [Cyclobacteriaceae bacterium]